MLSVCEKTQVRKGGVSFPQGVALVIGVICCFPSKNVNAIPIKVKPYTNYTAFRCIPELSYANMNGFAIDEVNKQGFFYDKEKERYLTKGEVREIMRKHYNIVYFEDFDIYIGKMSRLGYEYHGDTNNQMGDLGRKRKPERSYNLNPLMPQVCYIKGKRIAFRIEYSKENRPLNTGECDFDGPKAYMNVTEDDLTILRVPYWGKCKTIPPTMINYDSKTLTWCGKGCVTEQLSTLRAQARSKIKQQKGGEREG